MSDKCIFTICAKNYLGLAQVLEKSVKRNNPDIDFFIFIADEFETKLEELDSNVIVSRNVLNISDDLWQNMTFKYNVTEFCTSIKPFCFEYVFAELKYQKAVYLDPDTYLFSSIDYVYEKLNNYLFITAPHILIPELNYKGEFDENNFLKVGINNLGFLGVNNSEKSRHILAWWQKKLINQCFGEMLYGTSTDQKWMEFLQAFLSNDELICSKNMGLNIAPWNYFEREVVKENGEYFVVSRSKANDNKDKIIFVHFAGYNYAEFAKKQISNKNRIRINNLNEYKDINELVHSYVEEIWQNRESFLKFLNFDYSYGYFDDKTRIESLHRRLYNGLYTNFNYKNDPFKVGNGTFYNLLKKKGLIKAEKSVKVDSLTPENIDGFGKKLTLVYKLMRGIFKIMGYRKYVLFLQLIRRLSIYDLNTFLLGKEYENKQLR